VHIGGVGSCELRCYLLCVCEAAICEPNACCCLQRQHAAHAAEQHEEWAVVLAPYAVVDPLAVVVKAKHTLIALSAVFATSLHKSLQAEQQKQNHSAWPCESARAAARWCSPRKSPPQNQTGNHGGAFIQLHVDCQDCFAAAEAWHL
jgi:hypothetical protein